MPTYAYACGHCGHELEAFQSMKDDPLKDCPECREPRLRRIISGGAGIIFKGSGFYETDYKRAAQKGSEESGKSESGKSESGDSSKGGSETTQSKSEGAKSETKAAASGD